MVHKVTGNSPDCTPSTQHHLPSFAYSSIQKRGGNNWGAATARTPHKEEHKGHWIQAKPKTLLLLSSYTNSFQTGLGFFASNPQKTSHKECFC